METNMVEKIKQYFNEIFADAPKTRMALDLKQEMMQSAIDKYNDMVADGYSEEDAYQNVVSSIGDVTELFPEVEERNLFALSEKERKKKATLTSAAVGLYIFAGAVFIFFGMLSESIGYDVIMAIGFGLAILICIPPTVMLVYAANMYPDYTKKKDQDLVEQLKEVKYHNNREKAKSKTVNSLIWTVTLLIYFTVSMATFAWHVTWIIFLIAACVQKIVQLIFELRTEENNCKEKHL